jgi:hypothetical protein
LVKEIVMYKLQDKIARKSGDGPLSKSALADILGRLKDKVKLSNNSERDKILLASRIINGEFDDLLFDNVDFGA